MSYLFKLFWEKFEGHKNEIVLATPTRLFKALQDDLKTSQIAQKPILERRVYDVGGEYHPNSRPTDTDKVQLANGWGRIAVYLRTCLIGNLGSHSGGH